MIFLFIYSNNVGGTTVHNEGNAEGILLSPDTFQSNMLNLILKVDMYQLFITTTSDSISSLLHGKGRSKSTKIQSSQRQDLIFKAASQVL